MFQNLRQTNPHLEYVADNIKSVLEITKEIGVNQVKIVNAVRLVQRNNNNSGVDYYVFRLVILMLKKYFV